MGGQVLGYGGSGEGASQDADERDVNLDGGQKAVQGIGQLQAARAPASPSSPRCCSRTLRADTTAISA